MVLKKKYFGLKFCLSFYYDEAEYIIPQQVDSKICEEGKSVIAVSAKIDDFVYIFVRWFIHNDWTEAEVYQLSITKR